MTPSQTLVQSARETFATTDKKGRKLLLRRLAALDTLRLFKAADPDLSQNTSWLSMASLAFAVLEIDGMPIPSPATEAQIENVVDLLGDEGLAAIADVLDESQPERTSKEQVGNSPGIPS
jgi:hypothetical protein